ncbi:Tripartite DNA replication factor [Actinomortierella wolfii]|nr:Tripartite DNA replication factor [Actinomortierella wolfii]
MSLSNSSSAIRRHQQEAVYYDSLSEVEPAPSLPDTPWSASDLSKDSRSQPVSEYTITSRPFTQLRSPRVSSMPRSRSPSPSATAYRDAASVNVLSTSSSTRSFEASETFITNTEDRVTLGFYQASSNLTESSLSLGSFDLTAEQYEELDTAFAEMEITSSAAATLHTATNADIAASAPTPVPSSSRGNRAGQAHPHASHMYVPRRRPLAAGITSDPSYSSSSSAATMTTKTTTPITTTTTTVAAAATKISLETSSVSEGSLDSLAGTLASISLDTQHQYATSKTPPKFTPASIRSVQAKPSPRADSIRVEDPSLESSSHHAQATTQQLKGGGASNQDRPKFKFSPSVLAQHAVTSCEKMLHLSGMEAMLKAQEPFLFSEEDVSTRPSSIAEAHQKRGLRFEQGIIRSIPIRIECDKERDKDSYFRLATAPIGTTLCQAVFSLDESIYTPAMKQAGIVFGRFIPDFIRILPGSRTPVGRQKRKLYIIDAKSSKNVKLTHQFQVTLYAIFLEHLIKVNQEEDLLEVDSQGGVWIPAYKDPCSFSLAFLLPSVKNFIYQELPSILLKPFNKTVWHVHGPCSQCNYLEQCKKDAKEQKTLSLIPGLSKSHATWIRTLFRESPCKSEIDDIEDLVDSRHKLPETDRKALENCLRFNESGESTLLSVYKTNRIKVNITPTLSLPHVHDKRLLIDVMMDPLRQLPYAYSLGYYHEQNLRPSKSETGAVNIKAGRDLPMNSEYVRLTEDLMETLSEWLVQFSRSNITLTVFFTSQDIHNDFMSLLIRIISKNESGLASSSSEPSPSIENWKPLTVKRAMDLLCNLFEDAKFVELPATARYPVQLPDYLSLTQGYDNPKPSFCRRSFILEKAIKELTIMPILGAATFADMKELLLHHDQTEDRAKIEVPRTPDDLYKQWSQGDSAELVCESLQTWMHEKNLVILSLYSLLRRECSDLRYVLVAPQEMFRLRRFFRIQSPILAQFAYFLTWEIITSVEQKRERRLTAIKSGDPFWQQQAFHVVFEERWLGAIPNENAAADHMRSPDDTASPKNFIFKEPSNKRFSKFVGKFRVLTPCTSGNFDGGTISKWILSPENKEDILHDPNGWGRVAPEDSDLLVQVTKKMPVRRYGMTSSQDDAFANVMKQRLRIIWGPPGSGKTFFLASTILRYVDSLIFMAAGRLMKGREVTIILTAFTHSAVDNLVHRIVELHRQIAPRDGFEEYIRPLNIFRIVDKSQVETYSKSLPSEVQVCDAKALKTVAQGCALENGGLKIRIIAGTVWKVRVASNEKDGAPFMREADMVMIDEGSQLLAADAIHAIECLDPKNGRLVVAGDHMQLQPLVVGSYPTPRSGIDPTGSIMTNLMRDQNGDPISDSRLESSATSYSDVGPCTSQLLDNFRMNNQLGEFIKRIYGPFYQVYTSPEKKLPYSSTFDWNIPPSLQSVLDPSKSAVCIELAIEGHGRLANWARADNRVGAKVEAKMVAAIAEGYLQAVGRTTKTSLFIAVPHHVQRLAILNSISRIAMSETTATESKSSLPLAPLEDLFERGGGYAPLQAIYPHATIKVDTIEKMQGQEADCVIACFAMFDENALLAQLEFLYNFNRWVVGLSRARCKTIVMVSPQIREPKLITGASRPSPTVSASTGSSNNNEDITGQNNEASRPVIPTETEAWSEEPIQSNLATIISQRPNVYASGKASMQGWSLLQAFEEYASSLGAKQRWPLTEEALVHFELDS